MGNLRQSYTDEEWEEMQNEASNRAKLLAEAHRRFPKGTKFKQFEGSEILESTGNFHWYGLYDVNAIAMDNVDSTFVWDDGGIFIDGNWAGVVVEEDSIEGYKESQTVSKAPIFTYCKVNVDAIEALAFRAQYGHSRYNKDGQDEDWQNFKRVPNGDFEYSNAEFRHALGIGEEDEKEHLIAAAWNAVARLQIYLENNK